MGRPEKAGKLRGKSIIEDVNLFYQNTTALKYIKALKEIIDEEYERRTKLKLIGKEIE